MEIRHIFSLSEKVQIGGQKLRFESHWLAGSPCTRFLFSKPLCLWQPSTRELIIVCILFWNPQKLAVISVRWCSKDKGSEASVGFSFPYANACYFLGHISRPWNLPKICDIDFLLCDLDSLRWFLIISNCLLSAGGQSFAFLWLLIL